jgi:hypothetical protein
LCISRPRIITGGHHHSSCLCCSGGIGCWWRFCTCIRRGCSCRTRLRIKP